jgi:DNA polymerase III subunit delta'
MFIIGHQKNIEFLNKSIQNNKIAHAYLFYGPAHIGKTKVAEYFICSLFCSQSPPCFKCDQCRPVLKHFHPDNFWVRENSETKKIKIEQTRQIKEFVYASPFAANYKIVIIDKSDCLTLAAANSLLKILEEPPTQSILILMARNFKNLPVTLRSRCQSLRFVSPTSQELDEFLKNKYFLKEKERKEIIGLSLGRPGLAVNFVTNPTELAREKELLRNLVNRLEEDNEESRWQLADLMIKSEISLDRILNIFLILLRHLILIKTKSSKENYLNIPDKNLLKKYSLERLQNFINQILRTKFLLEANANKKLAIENLLINF